MGARLDSKNPNNQRLVTHLTSKYLGFEFPRKAQITQNRLKTSYRRSGHMLFKWRLGESEKCDCGYALQTTRHIINDCSI